MAFEIDDDTLRAIHNLNSGHDPNWLKVKEWLNSERVKNAEQTSLGLKLSDDQIRAMQGMNITLYNACFWFESPEDEMKIRATHKQREENTPIRGVS